GIGAASAFGTIAQQTFAPPTQPAAPASQPQQAAPQESDPMEVLTKLKKMLDAGLIEQSEYDSKKAEILSKM
ncbi:MAG: SHOCT domain-containing protein, partial [Ruminiclostridium sp.]|nr:SHOCT domain-containing protein [Ruminiclostridium sp.]